MEVQTILLLVIIHYAGIMIFKPKNTILGCGIFAWAGTNVKQFNKAKYDIQGLYNNSRGGDSSGVSTDGEIYHGTLLNKNYNDFIVGSGYTPPRTIPVVIGHTRKSSSGGISAINAHPFGFGDHNDGFEFIGVHNGTLHNQDELAVDYGVEETLYTRNNFGVKVVDRKKIDSEVLLECIYQSGNFKVLSDYIGGAALLFTNTKEPNVLYAFRGSSKIEKHGVKTLIDERPLYYYQEAKNSVYISSMPESLVAIGANIETVEEFDENTVYKITNGNVLHAEKIPLSRADAHQRASYSYQGVGSRINAQTSAFVNNACGFEPKNGKYANGAKNKRELRQAALNAKKNPVITSTQISGPINIHEEEIVKTGKNPIYFNKLRYYRNGHLLNGVYTWVDKYGLVLLTENAELVEQERDNLMDKAFSVEAGMFVTLSGHKDVTYPFNSVTNVRPPVLFMYEGILIPNELDFKMLRSSNIHYSIYNISEMSKHPIINLNAINKGVEFVNIILNNQPFTGTIAPLGSACIYEIQNGKLLSIRKLPNLDYESDNVKVINLPSITDSNKTHVITPVTVIDDLKKDNQLVASYSEMVQRQQNDDDFEKSLAEKYSLTDQSGILFPGEEEFIDLPINIGTFAEETIASELINDLMLPIYVKIQQANTLIEVHKNIPFAKEVIESNEEFLITMDEVIQKTIK